MKIAQINATCGAGSTGKICVSISKALTLEGIDNIILYSQGKSDLKNAINISCTGYKKLQALQSRVLGNYGFNSKLATGKLLRALESFSPDIVHIHNIHAHDCDLTELIEYLKAKRIRVFWTFHDCWAFTGYCTHFMIQKCEQWRAHCEHCPSFKEYSWFADRSSYLFGIKYKLLEGLDVTIITPSQWMESIVKQSFLRTKRVVMINNGIDLTVFKPTQSSFRKKHGIEDKFIILGVACCWGYEKGLDVFQQISQTLGGAYRVVLVGTDYMTDRTLKDTNIITIHRTSNKKELAEIYSAANLFLNPTREDTYPTVNLEAIACGTPVLTFNTGGSPESIVCPDTMIVHTNSVEETIERIQKISHEKKDYSAICYQKSREFDEKICVNKYLELYRQIMNGGIE